MYVRRRWHRSRRRGVAEIIGAVLLVALTLVAGVLLWTFHIYTAPVPPTVNFVIRSGGSNPVWGDPTDCQPQGTWHYPLNTGNATLINSWNNGFLNECAYPATSGNYSLLNTTELIFSASSPLNIPLNQIDMTFVCNGTVLLNGSFASMTWFPGSSTDPAPNAPTLGYCGTFDAGGYGGGAFSTYYNRLGLFVPIEQGVSVLQSGDTFILYIHTGGYPLDYACTTNWIVNYYGICGSVSNGPINDFDDYHGVPPWCFSSPGQCTIYLTYTGVPSTLLATIPVYTLVPTTG
jgi:flagellin-like protein